MPTYFFDVLDDGEVVADDEGIDLPDLDAARDKKRSGADCRGCVTRARRHTVFRVRDHVGRVFTLPFRETVKRL
jgi:hypothetical protein